MNLTEIFQKIVSVATLTPEHRESLRKKRGFTDKVIDQFKFRSSGIYLQTDARLGQIPEDVRDALFYDNILIPYLDPDGQVYHLRPHKYGFKGAEVQVFIPYQLFPEETPRLVLAESEFKAIASCLMGVPAIGIPGISSFSRKHLKALLSVLEGLNCKEVVVCFDNEVKDDPSFSNFKPDFTKRYDTPIYAYIMGAQLKKEGITTKIAQLKAKWRIDGKADIDGCLAQGVDPEEFQDCIDSGIDPHEFRNNWKLPPLHKAFVERKVDRFFYSGNIYIDHQSYFALREKKAPLRLTNFTIKIIHTLYSSAGAERYCRLESTYGNSREVIITPDIMVSKVGFQKFCYELGDYEFHGSDADLGHIWSHVIMHQDGRSITKLKSFGFDDESRIWFFQNGAYYAGKNYVADADGIVWVEDTGYLLPQPTGSDKETFMAPTLDMTDSRITIEEIGNHFTKVFHEGFARLILGWTLGNFFMPEILKEFKVYPFLFFYGKQQSGKSTLSNWVSSFFGFAQKGIPYSSSSQVGISRTVSQLSMIPVWLEEYRNQDPHLAAKNNLLRSIYDKSTIVKGTKREDEIKTYRARSTLMISGEEYPQDAALNSRCMLVPVYRHRYENSESYYWMRNNAPLFNQIGHHILLNRELYWPKIKERILDYLQAFETNCPETDSRSRIHHATLAGITDVFLGRDAAFETFLASNAIERTLVVDRSQAINVFYDDLVGMYGAKKLGDAEILRRVRMVEKEDAKGAHKKWKTRIAFWFFGAHMLWENYFRNQRNDIPASKNALLEHIQSEPYFIKIRVVKMSGKTQRCLILDEEHEKFPLPLRMIMASIDAENQPQAMPWEDEVMDENEVGRDGHQTSIPFEDNVRPLAGRGDSGAPAVGEE